MRKRHQVYVEKITSVKRHTCDIGYLYEVHGFFKENDQVIKEGAVLITELEYMQVQDNGYFER